MTLTRKLYWQFRQLIHEGAKFLVVGAIAFVITTGGTNWLHFQLGMGPLKSNVVATVVATAFAYAGNRYWTFRHREGSTIPRESVLFFVLNGVGLLIQLACIGATYYVFGQTGKLAYNIALVFGIGLGTLFRFWSYRRWVWLAPMAPPPGSPTVPARPDGSPGDTGQPAPPLPPLTSPNGHLPAGHGTNGDAPEGADHRTAGRR